MMCLLFGNRIIRAKDQDKTGANFRPAAPRGCDENRLRPSPIQADNCFSAIESHSA
jgi:hypothetical protein